MMLSLHEQRQLDGWRRALELHAERVSRMTREEARADLIATGIYTGDGDIHPDYGGERN